MLDFLPGEKAPRYALDIGDEVVLGKEAWIVTESVEHGFFFVQKEGRRLSQMFTNSQLG